MKTAYEQLENAEKAMECLRLAYWLSSCFLRKQPHSDIIAEIVKQYRQFSDNYEELLMLNSEIARVMNSSSLYGDGNGKKTDCKKDENRRSGKDNVNNSLSFINEHLYRKSDAESFNKVSKSHCGVRITLQ